MVEIVQGEGRDRSAVRVSIVMPVLNEADEIELALERLTPLRHRGCEVVVVDGGSSDATERHAGAGADRVLVSEPGRARQMNAGARIARGDVLVFLHVDTVLPEGADEIIKSALAESSWGRFDVRLSGRSWVFRIIERLMSWRSRLTGIATGDQVFFVRRTVFEAVDGFPEIALMEDIEMSRRLGARERPHCLRERVVTSSRRWEEGGILRTVVLMWSLRLAYWLGVSPVRLREYYRSRRV